MEGLKNPSLQCERNQSKHPFNGSLTPLVSETVETLAWPILTGAVRSWSAKCENKAYK